MLVLKAGLKTFLRDTPINKYRPLLSSILIHCMSNFMFVYVCLYVIIYYSPSTVEILISFISLLDCEGIILSTKVG